MTAIADWRDLAACQNVVSSHEDDIFFPESASKPEREAARHRALTLCRQCPVVAQCGAAVEDLETKVGIWGGVFYGLNTKRRTAVERRRTPAETLRKRADMYAIGWTDTQMAAAEGTSPRTITNWRHRRKLPVNPARQ